MKIFLQDQAYDFTKHILWLRSEPVMEFDKSKLREKTSAIRIQTDKTLQNINLDFFFDYKIFPTRILTFATEWALENRKMKVGDTIVQQVFLPPTGSVSTKAVFGVRVNRIIEERSQIGCSYQTVRGHVEK